MSEGIDSEKTDPIDAARAAFRERCQAVLDVVIPRESPVSHVQLRDQFAAAAVSGICAAWFTASDGELIDAAAEDCASAAYRIADEMMRKRAFVGGEE